jgi:hypothetical protein
MTSTQPRRSPLPHSSSSVGSATGASNSNSNSNRTPPQPLGSPKGSSRLLGLRGGGGGGSGGGGGLLPRSESWGTETAGAGGGLGGEEGGGDQWEQLEGLFGEAGRLAKARAKDLKALHATMAALATQGKCDRQTKE